MNKLLASYIHTVISIVLKAITTAMDEYGASKVSSAEAALEIAEQLDWQQKPQKSSE